MRNKKKRLVMRTIILTIIVAALAYTIWHMFHDRKVVTVGEEAPNFLLESLEGKKVKLSDYRGQVVLLNFWATWCGPCKEEMPYLQKAYEKFHDQGVVVLAVNIAESRVAVSTFAKRFDLTFPIVLDSERQVTQAYHIGPIPTTFVINPEGIVIKKIQGQMPDARYVMQVVRWALQKANGRS